MELKFYLEVFIRRWRTALLAAVFVVLMVALGNKLLVQPTYQAEARLLVIPPQSGSLDSSYYQATVGDRLLNAYVQLASSEPLKDELRSKLGLKKLPDIGVTIIPDTETIQILVDSSNPQLAAKTANLLAELVVSKQELIQGDQNDSEGLNILNERKEKLALELDDLKQEHDDLVLNLAQTSAQLSTLDREIKTKEVSYQNLLDRYNVALISGLSSRSTVISVGDELTNLEDEISIKTQEYQELLARNGEYQQQITFMRQTIQEAQRSLSNLSDQYEIIVATDLRLRATQGIQVISPAIVPSRPTGLSQNSVLLLSLICGLIAGIVSAFFAENLDTRIFSLGQIKTITKFPIISSISKVKNIKNVVALLGVQDSLLARDFWTLSTKLQRVIAERSVKTIMVTSPGTQEGKSTVVYGLASEMAEAGFKILIVDANLRAPVQHKLFNANVEYGLSAYVNSGEKEFKGLIIEAVKPGIDLLPSLSAKENQNTRPRVRHLKGLFAAIQTYDLILFDTPGLLLYPDTLDLAEMVDGVVVAVRWSETTSDDIKSIYQYLEGIGSDALGLVVNQTPDKKNFILS